MRTLPIIFLIMCLVFTPYTHAQTQVEGSIMHIHLDFEKTSERDLQLERLVALLESKAGIRQATRLTDSYAVVLLVDPVVSKQDVVQLIESKTSLIVKGFEVLPIVERETGASR